MPKRQGRGEPQFLSPQEWAEVKRITREIMEGFSEPDKRPAFERHIQQVLARNIAAAAKTYDTQAAAEEIHDYPPSEDTYQYPAHPISECSPDFCGRYAGQRRDSRWDGPPAMPGPTFRDARGALPLEPGSPRAEDVIRRLRDES